MCMHTHTHTHTSNSVQTVYKLPLLPNNTASETFLHKSERSAVLAGAGLAVAGRTRDIELNVFFKIFFPNKKKQQPQLLQQLTTTTIV